MPIEIIGRMGEKEAKSPETGVLEPWWVIVSHKSETGLRLRSGAQRSGKPDEDQQSEQTGDAETGDRVFDRDGLAIKYPASNRESQRCVAEMHPLHRSPPNGDAFAPQGRNTAIIGNLPTAEQLVNPPRCYGRSTKVISSNPCTPTSPLQLSTTKAQETGMKPALRP